MCQVKTGSDVKHECDLQNLVTHVILYQVGDFTLDSIMNEIEAELAGSAYSKETMRKQVEKLCKRTLTYMDFSDAVYSYGEGRYCLTVPYPSYMPTLKETDAD